MYQVGQLVVYGIHGVCRISQVQDRVVDRVSRRYLVLEPVNRGGSQYFVPMHNPTAMQKLSPLLSPEELTTLLSSERARTDCWIVDENRRKQFYRELSGSGRRAVESGCTSATRTSSMTRRKFWQEKYRQFWAIPMQRPWNTWRAAFRKSPGNKGSTA